MCVYLVPSSSLSILHLHVDVFSFVSLHCRHKLTQSKFAFSLLFTSHRVPKILPSVNKFVKQKTLTANEIKNNGKSDVQLHGVVALL